jgi:hypothetical protein
MINQVLDENCLLSVVINNVRHFTDGKKHFIERKDASLEYVGPLSEASADVIAAFLDDEKDCSTAK